MSIRKILDYTGEERRYRPIWVLSSSPDNQDEINENIRFANLLCYRLDKLGYEGLVQRSEGLLRLISPVVWHVVYALIDGINGDFVHLTAALEGKMTWDEFWSRQPQNRSEQAVVDTLAHYAE